MATPINGRAGNDMEDQTRIVSEGMVTCYYNTAKRHSYEAETDQGMIAVDANNRAEAENIANRFGHSVRSMNMVG